MDSSNNNSSYGTVEFEPTEDVVAGTYGTWKITYTVGSLGFDDGAIFKLAIHQTSDWGKPQFVNPKEDNYSTVKTSGDAVVEGWFDEDGHVRPYRHAIKVKVSDGSLEPGEQISLIMGDTSEGSLGQRAQTFAENDVKFRAFIDPHKTGDYLEVPKELSINIVPGEANSFTPVFPSNSQPGDSVTLSVRAEDYWGNIATSFDGTLPVELIGEVNANSTIDLKNGIGKVELDMTKKGVYRAKVYDEVYDEEYLSNPCLCDSDSNNTYWGDMHGQTRETVGHRTVQEYFDHLSNRAFLDFGSHAGNDFQISDEFWDDLKSTIKRYNSPGEFITFLCYEWSATTPLGGDHNVYFLDDDEGELNRSSKWLTEEGKSKLEGMRPVCELYSCYSDRDDVLIIPHQGGRPAKLDYLDEGLTPFIEITSVWGVFEWFIEESIDQGYQLGFVGGSDDHCGRPGTAPVDELRKHNVNGGLMATFADSLDRHSLWEAFTNQKVYATTGERILLKTSIDGAKMGDDIEVGNTVDLSVTVNGTSPIRKIDVFRNNSQVASTSYSDEDSECVEITWSGQRSPIRSRDKALDWTGGLSLSKGKILWSEQFGIDHPEEGIQFVGDTQMRWRAYTTGNTQGIRFGYDAPDDTLLTVSTPQATVSNELNQLPLTETSDQGVNAQIDISQVGRPIQLDREATYTDEPPVGTHSYYVRVTQDDGEMAWSTPIYVTKS